MSAAIKDGELPLARCAILVLEDETIISFLVEDLLKELGCEDIRHAANTSGALALLNEYRPDAALLDVNLGREFAYPVAMQLQIKSIPFVFATGYGRSGLAPEWRDHAVIQKPFDIQSLGNALRGVMGAARTI
jgi:CheY-like chemotaxis protein